MSSLRIERVNALPTPVTASTLYLIKSVDTGLVEVAVTNNDASETRHIINKGEIGTLIADSVAGFSNILLAANIAARDALTLDHNALVLVLDATGDTTVTVGAAMYFYDLGNTTWYKVTEFESLDVVLTWDSIQNKPGSTVVDIDDAVGKRHAHANATDLGLIGSSGGELQYNGDFINAHLAVTEW